MSRFVRKPGSAGPYDEDSEGPWALLFSFKSNSDCPCASIVFLGSRRSRPTSGKLAPVSPGVRVSSSSWPPPSWRGSPAPGRTPPHCPCRTTTRSCCSWARRAARRARHDTNQPYNGALDAYLLAARSPRRLITRPIGLPALSAPSSSRGSLRQGWPQAAFAEGSSPPGALNTRANCTPARDRLPAPRAAGHEPSSDRSRLALGIVFLAEAFLRARDGTRRSRFRRWSAWPAACQSLRRDLLAGVAVGLLVSSAGNRGDAVQSRPRVPGWNLIACHHPWSFTHEKSPCLQRLCSTAVIY